TEVREVIAGVEQSTAQQITQLKTEYQEGDRQTNAALQQTSKTLSDADLALGQRVDTVQAQVTQQGQTLSSAVQSEQQARTDADSALGQRVDTVQAQVTQQGQTLSAAVQTVAKAQADTAGQVEAGWYTKAQVNGEGGGFGLSVTLNADGSVLSSFVIDADMFAVLSRAAGVTSKRNPFVVKNGTVYMNHALMDTAEIGNVIAKYIKVTNIDAATIVNSDFKGGNAGFGRGGPYSGWGEGWHTIIYADGTIRTNRLYAAEGSFTGEVNANRGTFNNVVMRENCQILGKLSVNQIEGDVTRVYALESYVASNQISFTIPAFSRTRNLVISGIEIYARGETQGGGGDHSDTTITRGASCAITVNGSRTSDSVSATGSGSYSSTVCGRTVVIPPNQVTSVTIAFTGGYRVRGAVAMVFTQ
ncbi:DUF1983 domain-containing protein, partial [Aeromonas caviae]|uniref:phage tail tip fiber protein n=1 Tax=Aeromonas caviae TaxID=648 RepID=UPI0037540956